MRPVTDMEAIALCQKRQAIALEKMAKAQEKQTEYLRIMAHIQYRNFHGDRPSKHPESIGRMLLDADEKKQ